ncbi:MAG TPA: hypothetical protein DHW19_07395 [Acidimicrobiaceae bacterium]|nr:hypothetical protein [Acidimicrobiaceae bacterium]
MLRASHIEPAIGASGLAKDVGTAVLTPAKYPGKFLWSFDRVANSSLPSSFCRVITLREA